MQIYRWSLRHTAYFNQCAVSEQRHEPGSVIAALGQQNNDF